MVKGRRNRWLRAGVVALPLVAAALMVAATLTLAGAGPAAADTTSTTDCPTSTTGAPTTDPATTSPPTTDSNRTGAGSGSTTTTTTATTTGSTSTTTGPTSTTAVPGGSTSASEGSSTRGTGQRGVSGLAFTGVDAAALTLFGLGTILAGTLLVVSVRRRRRAGSDSLGCMLTVSVGYFLSTGTHHLSSGLVPASACDPGAQLPDAPMAILLPAMAVFVFGVFWLVTRRRDLFAGPGS